jgi:iron-sulfur cluster repair protein YtfE (RIC family)
MLEALLTLTDVERDELRSTASPIATLSQPLPRSIDPRPTAADRLLLFNGTSQRADLVGAYPELNEMCDLINFGWDQMIAERFRDPASVLLAMARVARPPAPVHHSDWSSSLVFELVSDLRNLHHRPVIGELQRLGILADRVLEVHPERHIMALHDSIRTLRQIVYRHVRHDDLVVFPQCIRIEEALHGRRTPDAIDVTNAIRVMADGHAAISHELTHSIAYVREALAVEADPDLSLVLHGLEAMTICLDMIAYGELEILLPAAISAEEQLTARKGA